ncbi:uncharacterized protein Z519_08352 [Cladophialophora bantiana CBS 173.52]|uniref:Heterokaryon incompatibility domain-containing protein n=1 Tax=Cladophialophora bantiana (strain ATCC 10958 / CBS 173.52 / CDC B-1940 / NIH 8579) TaxID=1442370 RepID=A0A0D2EN92_CLAB1|nr:uncharacterized protein Z519_08352 [Cladophialophora bantiana CBS 173.52]KIW91456.1 hypothetical protein Z519_08352 [Cladophialophora bantiana CBS 173.52]
MDHLPQPNTTTPTPLQVPFLARIEYNVGDFWLLYTRYDREGLLYSAEEVASFIQAWLYFGLLAEFAGRSIDPKTFLRREVSEDGIVADFVSLVPLKDLGLQLRPLQYTDHSDDDQDIYDLPEENDVSELSRLQELLKSARWICIGIEKKDEYRSSPGPLPAVLLSIRVLIDTLQFACLGAKADRIRPHGWSLPESALTVQFITRLMTSNGWCIFQINHVLRTFYSPLVWYIAQIQRHYRPEITHDKCTRDACTAFNINPNTYQTRHAQPSCSCAFIPIPTDEMRRIIKQGGIPLAFLERSGVTGEISLGVKAACATDSYVAFSHVWSDGLGNSSSNSLPRCELERLENYLNEPIKLAGNINVGRFLNMDALRGTFSREKTKLFWIDTLCIPVKGDDGDAEDSDELRWQAIAKINPVFAGANKAIILDSEIMDHVRAKSSDSCEFSARLLFSTWMGRCWTLNEAALSPLRQLRCIESSVDPTSYTRDLLELGFWSSPDAATFFRDDVYRYLLAPNIPGWVKIASFILRGVSRDVAERAQYAKKFGSRIEKMLCIPLEKGLDQSFLQEWKSKGSDSIETRERLQHFRACWNALARRETSRSEDRLKILANLLDLNMFHIISSPQPMMTLLRSLPGVPLSIFYIPKSDTTVEDTGVASASDKGHEAREDEHNRWLPLYPSRFQLVSEAFMTWGEEYLELEEMPDCTDLFMANPSILDVNTLWISETRYHVEFIRSANDDFTKRYNGAICLLIDRDDYRQGLHGNLQTTALRGACLQVLNAVEKSDSVRQGERMVEEDDSENHKTLLRRGSLCLLDDIAELHVSAVFDCPILLTRLPEETRTCCDGDLIITYRRVQRWSLKILHNCPESAALPFRKMVVDYTMCSYILMGTTAAPGIIVAVIAFQALVAIIIRSFFKRLWVEAAAMIVNLSVSPTLVLFETLDGLSRAIILSIPPTIYAYAKSRTGGTSNLDSIYIYSAFLTNGCTLLTFLASKFWLGPRIRKEWLARFNQGEATENELRWLRRAQKIQPLFEVIFDIYDKILGMIFGD